MGTRFSATRLNDTGAHVTGTIDVESEHLNAFDFTAQA
jgi:hypothetical protein